MEHYLHNLKLSFYCPYWERKTKRGTTVLFLGAKFSSNCAKVHQPVPCKVVGFILASHAEGALPLEIVMNVTRGSAALVTDLA